jgi:transcriptional regulator with XRE-family HTH domain
LSEYLLKLGKSIAEKRNEAGLTQSGLALKCDMDRQSMHKIEKGMVNISVMTLKKIAEELNLPPSRLLDFD